MELAKLVIAYRCLSDKKFGELETKDLFNLVDLMNNLRPMVEDYDKSIKQIYKSVEKENHEEMQELADKHNTGESKLDQHGLNKVNHYFAEMQEKAQIKINDLGQKKVKLNFKKLSKKAYEALMNSVKNDLTLSEVMIVDELLK